MQKRNKIIENGSNVLISRADTLEALNADSVDGRIIESHSVPCKRPSNCTFGGENLDILYVTTLEGHLFMVKNTGRQGYLLYPEK